VGVSTSENNIRAPQGIVILMYTRCGENKVFALTEAICINLVTGYLKPNTTIRKKTYLIPLIPSHICFFFQSNKWG
jgi:hypothetical protein